MTISTEIARLKTSIANAYDALEAKGAIIPAIENPDNLVYAIDTISVGGGDEITATNTTGSAVSADDRVWVNSEDVYTQNFTQYGGTVANKLLTITGSQQGIIQQVADLTFPTTLECVFKVKFTDTSNVSLSGVPLMSVYSDTNSISSDSYRGCQFYVETGDKHLLWNYIRSGSTNSAGVDFNNLKLGDLTNNQWYWFRLYLTSSSATASYSIDGENWTIGETYNYGPNSSYFNTKYIKLGCPTRFTQSTSDIIFDLSECYVKVDGTTVWTPYTKTGTNYSIINDTDITSTSFTGVAQDNISNNASGSVKTLLDGNGTYAPTTATKSITTNGTYTASAENAYGLSEVTVDVPTINNTTVSITPTRSFQTFTPESPYTGYSRVRVYGVTRSIDTNIQSNNIKDGVSILGVMGTLTPTPIKEWCNWKTPFSWSSTTKRLSNTQYYSRAIAYGDGNFVTVTLGSKAEYSTDGGSTWSETNMPSSADWSCVAYGSGTFVALASTYSSQTGSNKAAYSTDGGVTWNSATLPNTRIWNDVAYGDGKFIAVASNSNKAAYSSDGITWAEIDIPQNKWVSIAYGNGSFVVIPYLSYNAAYSTDGGTTWHTSRLSFDNPWKCVAYGNGVFVAVDSSGGNINYSTDGGATWNKSNWSTWRCFYSVAYGDGKFVAIAKNESTRYAAAIYSTDGNTWTVTSNFPNTSKMTSMAYGNGVFVCTGSTNTIEIGSQSSVYTLEAEPTTASTVYSAPNIASALTITSIGTGTITCSDTKVYNRNSADDEDYVINITQNGTYDVTEYVSAVVDVPLPPTKKYNLLDRVIDDSNNEIGTVSGFFTDANNVEYAVVCLDAQYRLRKGDWCSDQSAVVTGLPVYEEIGPWEAKETATFNTQKIIDYCSSSGATSDACSHCRSKSFTIDGTTYYGQLPNMIELNDIARNATALNTADITANSYTSVNFTNMQFIWSSSQCMFSLAWQNSGGHFSTDEKSIRYGVVPVLEIPNT